MRVFRIVLLIMVLVALTLGSVSCDLFSGGGNSGGGTPAVPTGLTVGTPAPFWVYLSWNASSGATSYQVYRDTSSGGTFATQVYAGSDTSLLDGTVLPGGTYYYKITASNSSGSSGLSGAVSGTAIGTVPWMGGTGDGTLWYMTNDNSLLGTYGYLALFNITTSTLSLGQTLASSVNQVCGSSNSALGVRFFRQDASNYWMFVVYPPDPGYSGYYEIDQVISGSITSVVAPTSLAMNAIGTANTLKVTYTQLGPSSYQLAFYVNGVSPVQTLTSASFAGAGGTTGFVAYISNLENFPTVPVWDTFAQTSPVAFSGSMAGNMVGNIAKNIVPGGALLKTLDRALIKLPARPTGTSHPPAPLNAPLITP